MKSTLILNAKDYFLHSYMPSRKNATNLSEPLAFIQFSSYPPKWAFTNPPCFVQKLLASSSKYRDCKRKGGILVYKSLVVLAEKKSNYTRHYHSGMHFQSSLFFALLHTSHLLTQCLI